MIYNNLKSCREQLEMTQKELAKVFNVTESTVSGWETNNDVIPLRRLIEFCNLYNFSANFVVGLSRSNIEYNDVIKVDKEAIGKTLKSIRKKLGLTQQEMADECAISQTALSNYELGITLITTLTLYTICKKYNITMDFILGRKKKKSDS